MARAKKEAAPESVVPAEDFAFVYHAHLLTFRAGEAFFPDAQLLAALKAANAPLKD